MRRNHIVQAVSGALLLGLGIVACTSGPQNGLFPFEGGGTSKFVYVVGDSDVSAFTFNAGTGNITLVTGSPFLGFTNGGPDWAAADPAGKFLFVPDADNSDIVVFKIDQSTGALTPVPGSPFSASDVVEAPVVDPSGKFLYVSDDTDISAFKIGSDGALTLVTGSPFPTGGTGAVGVVVHPNGKFLIAANSDDSSIAVFKIDLVSGALAQITGSPFLVAPAAPMVPAVPLFLAIHPNGKFLYVTDTDNTSVLGFSIDPASGALTALTGFPVAAGLNPKALDIDPAGHHLFVADSGDTDSMPPIDGNIIVYTINSSTGALTPSGAPFAVLGTNPIQPVVDASGKFLYVTNDDTDNVSAFKIDPLTGALTPLSGSPFTTSKGPGGIVITPRRSGSGT